MKNIFCLEGDWWGNLKKPSSVRPIFDLVAQMEPKLRYIYRGIGTREEFDHYLGVWKQRKFADYPILYLAFHGKAKLLEVGDQRRTTRAAKLDDIAEVLANRCSKRFIHLGACSALACDKRHLSRFLRTTGALAVSGYTRNVDWIESAAFEIFLLSEMQSNARTISGARAIAKRINLMAKKQAKELGFRMVVANKGTA